MLSPLWPGCVLLVSVLLLVPRRTWPVLIAAAFAAFILYDLRNGVPIRSIAWLILADTVEVLTAALCLSYSFDGVPQLNSVRALAKYSIFAVILAPVAGAFVGALAFRGEYWMNWRISSFSEALAFLTLMPAIFGWVSNGPAWRQKSRAYCVEAAALITALVIFGYFVFVAPEKSVSPALLYSLVPFLLWSALRFGSMGVSTSVVVIAFLSIWGATRGQGPFTEPSQLNNVLPLQLFLFFSAAPFMVLAALVEERQRAAEELREDEERLHLAMAAGKMVGWEWDIKSGRNPWLGEARTVMGMTPAERSGSIQDFWDRVHPEDHDQLRKALEIAKLDHVEFDQEFRVVWPDKTVHWLRSAGRFFYAADGEPERMMGVLRDVTVRKLALEAVRQREAELREAQRLAKLGSWQWDPETDRVTWSEEVYRIAGRDPNLPAVSYKEHPHLYTPESWERLRHGVEEALRTGTPYELDVEMIRSDGSKKWLHARGEARRNNLGRIVQLHGTVQDITERKHAEKTLRESEERFRLAAQAGKMFAYEWDATTDLVVRSAESAQILGIDEATDSTSQQILAMVHPDDRERLLAGVAELSLEKPWLEISYRMVRPDGALIWVERNSRAHFDEQGRMLRIIGMVTDITERKRAEKELRESEEKFRSVFRDAGVGMAIVSPDGRFLAGNEAFSKFIGYTKEELFGKTVQSITHPEDWPMFSKRLSQALTDGASFQGVQKRCLHKNGQVLCGECSASLIRDIDGKPQYFVAEVLDITERKRAEKALRESEKRFRLVADTAPALIWMSGTDKLCTFFNKGWLEFTGRTLEQEMGEGWASGVHPEDLERCLRIYSGAFDARVDFDMEYRLRRFDGKYRWIVDYGVPRFESDETFCGYVGSCVDITERKLTADSLEELSGRLITAQEEERARIARELHDDFSQRLALLGIGLGRLWKKRPESEEQERILVRELWSQTKEISSDLHRLSHQLHSSKLEHVGLGPALIGLCEEISEKYGIQIEFKERDVPLEIAKDVALCLFRITQEALSNVVKHSQAQRAQVELCGASNKIRLQVADTGLGFDSARGSADKGIGLIGMRERLRLVGGSLSVESAPMQGTEILVEVPLSASANERAVRTKAVGG
jgi:PAS domain S-box-containing protein